MTDLTGFATHLDAQTTNLRQQLGSDPASLLRDKIDSLRTKGGDVDRQVIKKVAREFEQVFLQQMISTLYKDVDMGRFGGGFGEKLWREQLFGQYAEGVAKTGTIGIAEAVEREILRLNGVEQTTLAPEPSTNTKDQAALRRRATDGYARVAQEADILKDGARALPASAITPFAAGRR